MPPSSGGAGAIRSSRRSSRCPRSSRPPYRSGARTSCSHRASTSTSVRAGRGWEGRIRCSSTCAAPSETSSRAGSPASSSCARIAVVGLVTLIRERPSSALLTGLAIGVPVIGLMLALGGSAGAPETRHLIFVLPFFALLLAVGVDHLAGLVGARAGPSSRSWSSRWWASRWRGATRRHRRSTPASRSGASARARRRRPGSRPRSGATTCSSATTPSSSARARTAAPSATSSCRGPTRSSPCKRSRTRPSRSVTRSGSSTRARGTTSRAGSRHAWRSRAGPREGASSPGRSAPSWSSARPRPLALRRRTYARPSRCSSSARNSASRRRASTTGRPPSALAALADGESPLAVGP